MDYDLAVNRLRKGFAWMEGVDYSRTRLGASVTVHTHITSQLPCLFDQWPFCPENPIKVNEADAEGRKLAVLRLAGIPILVNSGPMTWAHLSGMRFFSTSPFCKKLNGVGGNMNPRPRMELGGLLNECLPYKTSWEYSFRYATLSWGHCKHFNRPLIEVTPREFINCIGVEQKYVLTTPTNSKSEMQNYRMMYPDELRFTNLPLVALTPFDDRLAALSEYVFHYSAYNIHNPAPDKVAFFKSDIFPAMTTSNLVLGTTNHRPCPWGPPSKWSPK